MENKQQTAVSEMFAQIKAARKDTQFWNDSMLVDWLLESEERFKQIEKEQIMQSYKAGNHSETRGGNVIFEKMEQYYQQTYGGNK